MSKRRIPVDTIGIYRARMRRWEGDLVSVRDMFTRLKGENLINDM